MKHPKQDEMALYVGRVCRFVKGELHRTYLKKQIKGVSISDPFYFNMHGHPEVTPVRWKTAEYTPKEGFTVGWIVGFGFCFDGSIIKQGMGADAWKTFKASKRHNYVRVRLTPTGKELKILAKNIKKVFYREDSEFKNDKLIHSKTEIEKRQNKLYSMEDISL